MMALLLPVRRVFIAVIKIQELRLMIVVSLVGWLDWIRAWTWRNHNSRVRIAIILHAKLHRNGARDGMGFEKLLLLIELVRYATADKPNPLIYER